jgi:hypothetical protein
LSENPKGRDHLGDVGIDGSIIFKWLLKKMVCGWGLDSCGSRYGLWQALVNMVMNLKVP